jgi:hypothetical protein
VFFRRDFGGDPLEWPLFPNYPVNSFHDLRLRAGKNDPANPFIEDEYMRRLFIGTGQQGSRGMINTLYVNGVYKGYYNTCEHLREDFFQRHHNSQNAWDVRQVNAIASGDGLAFQEMITFIRSNPQNVLANYQAMATRLDMVNFADYLLTNLVGVTGDWPHNNYVCARERSDTGIHRYYMWDAEGAFGDFNGNVRTNMFSAGTTASLVTATPATASLAEGIRILYTLLRASPEFKLLMADRIQKHFFNGGALTNEKMLAEWNAMKAEFSPLIAPTAVNDRVTPWFNGVGDPSRYSTTGTINTPSRRNVLFSGYYNDTAGGAFVAPQFVAEGLWPATKAPVLSQHGGVVAPGYRLTLSHSNPDGTIYYTIDGTDPRAAGGVARGTAYTTSIPINFWTTIKTRVRRTSGEWSPLTEANFDPGVTEPLLLTEIMYHPPDNGAIDGDNYEFIELKNPSAYPIQLGGMSFTSGVSYTFPNGTSIGPGQCIVLARNRTRFAEIYPTVVPMSEWGIESALANSGETITLVNAAGRSIFSFSYSDIPPWPTAPDGGSHSLVPIDADANPNPSAPGSWRASSFAYGSPGMDDPVPAVPRIYISEILANAVAPEQDWIELHNPNDFPVDIGDWWLSDSDIAAQKYRIPAGSIIPPGGYRCFTEAEYSAGGVPFGLSRTGETARLSSGDVTGALTGYTHSIRFGASSPGESHGNYVNSQGTALFVAQQAKTFGAVNGSPRNGPVVISEIMHSPNAGGDEFLELCNVTDSPVDLFDPSRPTNGWTVDGIGWTFTGGITLEPRQVILVTQIAPATFRSKYNISQAIAIFGPYSGSLDGSGELIKLQKPGVPYLDSLGATVVPYIDVDQVSYSNMAPWPILANEGGHSLERVNLWAFGDDVANWQASPTISGTIGAPSAQPLNVWLTWHFTTAQLNDSSIGAWDSDPDGDRLNNFQEWAHGLDPWRRDTNPVSYFIETDHNGQWFQLTVRRSRSAAGLQVFGDTSPDLLEWYLGEGELVGPPQDHGDGTETLIFRHIYPVDSSAQYFMRARLTQ